MCLGIPTQIIQVTDPDEALVLVELEGVRREVNVAMLLNDATISELIGCWVIVHAGFAIGAIDEEEAQKTLDLLAQVKLGQGTEQAL